GGGAAAGQGGHGRWLAVDGWCAATARSAVVDQAAALRAQQRNCAAGIVTSLRAATIRAPIARRSRRVCVPHRRRRNRPETLRPMHGAPLRSRTGWAALARRAASLDGLWRAADAARSRRLTEGERRARRFSRRPDLSGHRTEGRRNATRALRRHP